MSGDKCTALGGSNGPEGCNFSTSEGDFSIQSIPCDKNAFGQVKDATFTKEDLATISKTIDSNAIVTFAICTDSYRDGIIGIAPDALAKQHDASLRLFQKQCAASGLDQAKCDAIDKSVEENGPEKASWVWEGLHDLRNWIGGGIGFFIASWLFEKMKGDGKPTDKSGGAGGVSEAKTTTTVVAKPTVQDLQEAFGHPMALGALDFASGSEGTVSGTLLAPVIVPMGAAIAVPAY